MTETYLEINLSRKALRWLLAGMALLTLIGLGVLGRFRTPDPPHVIWWADWTQWKMAHKYRQELARMKGDLAELAETLQSRPDPVRAELTASRMEQRYTSGLGLLEAQREVTIDAALAVRDWAAGYGTYDAAVQAVNEAIGIMERSEYHIGGSDDENVREKADGDDSTGGIGTSAGADEEWWDDGK